MPTVNETPRAETWLFQTLAAAIPTVTAYSTIAPEGAAQPFIIFQQQATSDLMGVGPGAYLGIAALPGQGVRPDHDLRSLASDGRCH